MYYGKDWLAFPGQTLYPLELQKQRKLLDDQALTNHFSPTFLTNWVFYDKSLFLLNAKYESNPVVLVGMFPETLIIHIKLFNAVASKQYYCYYHGIVIKSR